MTEGPSAGAFGMVRPGQPDDLTVLRSITATAYAPYHAVLHGVPGPVLDDHAARLAAGQVWLLEAEGEPVGVLVLERHADHAMVFSVAVSPERQGNRYGLTLLRFAEQTARDWGLAQLRLYTNVLMHRNRLLYRAAGFRETGERPHPTRPGFAVVDMVLLLGPETGSADGCFVEPGAPF